MTFADVGRYIDRTLTTIADMADHRKRAMNLGDRIKATPGITIIDVAIAAGYATTYAYRVLDGNAVSLTATDALSAAFVRLQADTLTRIKAARADG